MICKIMEPVQDSNMLGTVRHDLYEDGDLGRLALAPFTVISPSCSNSPKPAICAAARHLPSPSYRWTA